MELSFVFRQLGIAVGLGLLVGLQRQRSAAPLAGFRTFPLVTTFGLVCALLAESYGGWVVVGGLLVVAAMLVLGNYAEWKAGKFDAGLTTEIALLVMYGVGAYLVVGHTAVAIAIGAGLAVLLYLKPQLHHFAAAIGDPDFKAIMQFVLITLVILPVLPDRAYGPFDVLNPHRIWLMVTLIVGISLGGYVCYKFFGARAGAVLAGVLGGTISSTATTVSYARQARQTPGSVSLAVFVIVVASAVVFARVLILCATVAPQQFVRLAPPVAVLGAVMALVALVTWFSTGRDHTGMGEQANPTQLRPALVFGALFAVVLFAVAAVRANFGEGALYAVAILSGATDMDAITLSTAQMVQDGRLGADTGWRLIVAASLSNLVFKAAAAGLLGGVELFRRLAVCFGVALAAGALLLALWPH
jgi:uncharacterized membrane protein (DUF4010 family)